MVIRDAELSGQRILGVHDHRDRGELLCDSNTFSALGRDLWRDVLHQSKALVGK
jgi:hypothetical protein